MRLLGFVVSSYFFHPHAHRVALICLDTGALTFGLYEYRNKIFNQQCPTWKKNLPQVLYYKKGGSLWRQLIW